MVLGLGCILAGVLIALYPQILIVLISGFFILAGVTMLVVRWQFRRAARQFDQPWGRFFMRF